MESKGTPERSRELRTMALTMDSVSVELAPTPDLPRVYGVVMDLSLKDTWASVVVIADVTTSMYSGNGVGFVQMERQQSVADASKELLLVAERHLEAFDASTSLVFQEKAIPASRSSPMRDASSPMRWARICVTPACCRTGARRGTEGDHHHPLESETVAPADARARSLGHR